MALTRKHFTTLAEIIGGVESGRIGPDDLRAVVIEHLLEVEPQFKRDKFDAHTDKQRDAIERVFARDLKVGEGFVIGGQRLVAERIVHLKEHSLNVDSVEVRALVEDDRVDTDDNRVTLFFDPADRI